MIAWLPRLIARVPQTVHTKLLVAFLAMVLLLIALGTVGLQTLTEANRRVEELLRLQRNIAVYRQLQHDAIAQLYSVTAAMLVPEESTLQTALRGLYQFGYDVDRLQVAARDDVELLARVQAEHADFVKVVNQVVDLIRSGQVVAGRELQVNQARPSADRIERLMNELVNRAEAEMVASADDSRAAYQDSRRTVIAFVLASSALAMLLGYAISQSLIVPVKQMNEQLREIGTGNFSQQLTVANRDELGTLAANLNAMNAELGRLYRQLEAANRHKSEFLANMSHELRTPLNAIIGFSDVLAERMFGELNDKQAEYIDDIHSSGHHLLALINDILDLSKIEAGRMELNASRFNLHMLIDNAVTLVHERAARKGIAVEVSVEDGLHEIDADERKVKQTLVNLLSNAVKFTPEGGRVSVSALPVPGAVEVSVSDTGIGIAAADQEMIFEEFRQANAAGNAAHEGSGLGLALARKFVEMHGGRIRVRSEPGHGATFSFTLPVQS